MSSPLATVRPPRLTGLSILFALLMVLVSPASPPAQSAAGAAASWQWPIDPPHQIVNPFVAPATKYSAGHRGIDIAAAVGSPVLAPADGVVSFAGFVVDRPVLSIRHPGGLVSSYEPVSTALRDGATVHRGQTIGAVTIGAVAAHCTASCLHLGVRLDGEYVSPLNYLGGIPHSVLLPTAGPDGFCGSLSRLPPRDRAQTRQTGAELVLAPGYARGCAAR
ncbi:MAG: family metallopeptidase [Microbacteriaceae bacterium]|nr:family metallopeptidase [Microbacteriaceae bacterium]